jgi:hypothetical protein
MPQKAGIVALVFALIAVSCGGRRPADEVDSSRLPDGEPGVSVTAAEIQNLRDLVGDDARELDFGDLEDGFLSVTEFERALYAYVQCMEGAGIQIEPLREPGGYVIRGTYLGSDRAAADVLAEPCRAQFQPFQMLWAGYEEPGYQDVLAEAEADLAECLRLEGIDMPEVPAEADFDAVKEQDLMSFLTCLKPVKEKYGLFSWVP